MWHKMINMNKSEPYHCIHHIISQRPRETLYFPFYMVHLNAFNLLKNQQCAFLYECVSVLPHC